MERQGLDSPRPLRQRFDGDVFALLSDGLTNHVRDEEIALAVNASPDLQLVCDSLVNFANDRGGSDNITVLLVRCEKAGEARCP